MRWHRCMKGFGLRELDVVVDLLLFLCVQLFSYLSGIKPETTGLVASHHVGKGGIPLIILC